MPSIKMLAAFLLAAVIAHAATGVPSAHYKIYFGSKTLQYLVRDCVGV